MKNKKIGKLVTGNVGWHDDKRHKLGWMKTILIFFLNI